MTVDLSPDWLIDRFRSLDLDPEMQRGDHDLNPGMTVLDDLTPAAVLVPLVAHAARVTTLFTQRTSHLKHHAGQISFPGGHADPEDDDAVDTALREMEEEVGLHRRQIRVIGQLDPYITRTGFSVIPVVGLIEPPFDVSPDPNEVEDVFEVPLDFLMNPANHQRHRREVNGTRRDFYAMPYGERFIWGATAGMVKNLYDVLVGGGPDPNFRRDFQGVRPSAGSD